MTLPPPRRLSVALPWKNKGKVPFSESRIGRSRHRRIFFRFSMYCWTNVPTVLGDIDFMLIDEDLDETKPCFPTLPALFPLLMVEVCSLWGHCPVTCREHSWPPPARCPVWRGGDGVTPGSNFNQGQINQFRTATGYRRLFSLTEQAKLFDRRPGRLDGLAVRRTNERDNRRNSSSMRWSTQT